MVHFRDPADFGRHGVGFSSHVLNKMKEDWLEIKKPSNRLSGLKKYINDVIDYLKKNKYRYNHLVIKDFQLAISYFFEGVSEQLKIEDFVRQGRINISNILRGRIYVELRTFDDDRGDRINISIKQTLLKKKAKCSKKSINGQIKNMFNIKIRHCEEWYSSPIDETYII